MKMIYCLCFFVEFIKCSETLCNGRMSSYELFGYADVLNINGKLEEVI